MRRHPPRRGGWTRGGIAWIAAVGAVLWLTGVVLYAWPAESLFDLAPWQVALRRGAVVVHGTCVWLLCFLAGHWLWSHLAQVWRRRPGTAWLLGLAGAALLLLVAASGLLLLYGTEAIRAPASATHWWSAVALPGLLVVHGLVRAKRR